MPSETTGVGADPGRRRRLVELLARWARRRSTYWGLWLLVMAIAAIVHAHKAADDRGAFVRWRGQILQFWQGENIYTDMLYPNPPIMPISLYPLIKLPPLVGAMTWFALKVALAAYATVLCLRMAREPGRRFRPWAVGLALLLSFRPILSDLHHANNNIVIMFLIVAALYAWRRGLDVLAGLTLALAISYKITPALFVPYFLYKRSWRTVTATVLGVGLFLLVIPALVIGPTFNSECLGMWYFRILSPYVSSNFISPQEMNQSLVGVLTRLLTEAKLGNGRYDEHLDLNLLDLDPVRVALWIKGLSLAFVALLAAFCRTRARRRDDPRMLGEFSLVVLTMLFVSERSWKHHYVTLLLPYVYLTYRFGSTDVPRRVRSIVAAALALSALLIATTSSELGGLFSQTEWHKVAQGYGMFLWGAVVLYIATAWRVVVEGRLPPSTETPATAPGLPAPHAAPARRGDRAARRMTDDR